jgi:hypothetical protein
MGVITATAKTRKYLVAAQRDDGTQTAIDVPVIQQIAGGNVKVEAAAADDTKVSFEGNVPLVFGIQGISISFDENGRFTAFDPMKVAVGAVRGLRLAAVSQPKMLLTQAIFVDVVSKAKAATA